MSDVTIEKSGRIAIVRFDRGVRANPLSLQLMRDLTEAARSFETDTETSAVILTGGANFSMGFDLRDQEAAAMRAAPLAKRRMSVATGRRMCQAWADLQPLTISAINGWCVGGGAALAIRSSCAWRRACFRRRLRFIGDDIRQYRDCGTAMRRLRSS